MLGVRALVTGATGKVGHAVARALSERGDEVRALVRDPQRAAGVLPVGVEPSQGDVTDAESVQRAVAGCELVFNAMGLPEQWLADAEAFEQINARGTETVVRAAAAAGVRRLVHTSTIDVFHAESGARFDESRVAGYPKGTAYERSKQRARNWRSPPRRTPTWSWCSSIPLRSMGLGQAAAPPRSSRDCSSRWSSAGEPRCRCCPRVAWGSCSVRVSPTVSCWRPSAVAPASATSSATPM